MPKVTVIIPVYNCEEYLQECLDSVYSQTYDEYEIITVNDGSTDGSLQILQENQKSHSNFHIIDQTNHGQGYGRNRALEKARGEYVLFLDSDDCIEQNTLRDAVARMVEDNSDLAHFGWRYSGPERKGASTYLSPTVAYRNDSILRGGECDKLLSMTHFYSVNNLYRRSFLNTHAIRYGEGYIYEDNLFMTLVANRASCISVLYEPYYIVRRSEASSTRSGKDRRHADSFLRAVEACIGALKPRTRYTTYYMAKYFQTKFIFYYMERVPFANKREYLRRFVDLMSRLEEVHLPEDGRPERILRLCLDRGIYKNRKYNEFKAIILYKTKILPLRDHLRRQVKKG